MSRPARTRALATYLHEIGAYPVLSREAEQATATRLRADGGEGDAHELIQSNLGFVVRVALDYKGMGLPLEDLLNEGNVGLIEAARRFDPERGTRFITFAVFWIRKALLRALSRHASVVRRPGHQRRRLSARLRTERSLEARLGRRPGRDEVSAGLGVPVAEVERLLSLRPRDVSIEEPLGDDEDGPTLGDALACEGSGDPEVELLRRESHALVESLLGDLSERERRVLIERYGLAGHECRTLREIAADIGLSREAIRLVEERALRRLRRIMAHRRHASGRTPSTQATA